MSMAPVPGLGRLQDRAVGAVWRRVRSGSGIWLGVAIAASGLKLLVRLSRRQREVVYRGELAPGERLTIEHLPRGRDEENLPADRV